MKIVIGISGPIGAGKDTFASALGRSFLSRLFYHELMSFADPIRRIAQRLGLNPFCRATKETPQRCETFAFRFTKYLQDEGRLIGVSDADLARVSDATLKRLGVQHLPSDASITISPRHFMQALGNGARDVNPHFWIDALRARIKWSHAGVVVVSDVRFPNEMLVADDLVYVEREGSGVTTTDESEAHHEELREFADWVVDNNGSLEDLAATADAMAYATIRKWEQSR